MPEFENPFYMGELDNLFNARMNGDVEYLSEWSKRAVEEHTKDGNNFMRRLSDLYKRLNQIRVLTELKKE